MAYSMDPSTDLCYEGTACLINKFSIKDPQKLSELEAQITFAKAVMLDAEPIEGKFDFHHYKQIHQFLFCDLYDWAGEVRTVNISKKGTQFTPADKVPELAERVFKRLNAMNNLKGLPHDEFVDEIVDLYCATNSLHPFREGNGRTQRAFFTQLIRNADYEFSFADMDTELLMIATIQSAQGVTDMLKQIFHENIKNF